MAIFSFLSFRHITQLSVLFEMFLRSTKSKYLVQLNKWSPVTDRVITTRRERFTKSLICLLIASRSSQYNIPLHDISDVLYLEVIPSDSIVLSVNTSIMKLVVEKRSLNNRNQLWRVVSGKYDGTYNLVHNYTGYAICLNFATYTIELDEYTSLHTSSAITKSFEWLITETPITILNFF